jgi:putative two-component system response regulator
MELNDRILQSRILIVDDDVALGMTLEEMLKENEYTKVRYISDSRQAADVFKEFHPDLLMLDINMPHLDGFGVMEQIRGMQLTSFVPILVLSAETDEDISLRALSMGATDFLNKPYKASEVLARIQNMLRVRQLQNDLESKNDFLEDKVEDRTAQLRQAVKDLDQMHAQVKEAYIETIYRLTRATEYKDEETADHVKRLSLYAAAVGRAIGMKESDVELLLYASPMHDIGKIGIPDSILFKRAPLTEEEWKTMKSHPMIGYEILKESKAPVLKLGATIALGHHERWDGSGYPQGLKGEQIPLEARILALVDIYDALRSKRHYKEAFDHQKTCKIILEGDGRVMPQHFDPKLLEVFKKIHGEFEKIFDDHNR